MLRRILSLGLNNCLQCGSFGFRPSQLCIICEDNLFQTALNSQNFNSVVQGVSCMALFRWHRDRNRILNRLAIALKGTRQQAAWDYYAQRFLSEGLKQQALDQNAILVPCPASGVDADHAYLFALALARWTGIPLVPLLERVDAKEQKGLNRRDRERRSGTKFRLKASLNEKFSLKSTKAIYFVDDIITTGATVLAAHTHLKKLGHVKAISLIIRE